ncbi:hypothetical protein N202_08075 [Helicobacter pylori UM067]|nr:hypothetical protein N202_08075 [Helicobacter pylori UM067]
MYQESAFIPAPPNETKSIKIKKMTKFSRNDKKKKKRFYVTML